MDQANAESIFGVISSMLEDGGLSWDNVIGYCSDGANVMRGSRNSVMTRILARQPHAYTRHCVCHVAQLCAQAACDALLPDNFQDWLQRVAYFFDRSPKRTAALRKVQQEYDVKQHKLVKPAPTRWLSLHASVMRMLEQWEALLHYFQSCPDVCQLQNVMDWVSLMERPETKAYLLFLGEVLPLFVTFNLSFQSEDVKVHLLSKSQAQLHRMLLFNCVKASAVRGADGNVDTEIQLDIYDDELELSRRDMIISADAMALLATLPDERRKRFATRVRSFYQTAVVQVRRRLPLTCPVLRGLEFLCPVAGKDCAAQSVADVARAFPHAVSTGSLDALVREWQCYQCTTHKNLPTEATGMQLGG